MRDRQLFSSRCLTKLVIQNAKAPRIAMLTFSLSRISSGKCAAADARLALRARMRINHPLQSLDGSRGIGPTACTQINSNAEKQVCLR